MLDKALPYIHRFIELMVTKNILLNEVVLYGSFADDTASPVSDIDLKIFVRDKNQEKRVLEAEDAVNGEISKDKFRFYIKSMILTKEDTEHIESGILLWGSPIKVSAGKKGLIKKRIITYDTTPLNQVKRAELVRRLLGYKTKKKINNKSKTYGFDGSIKQLSAKRLRNAILVEDKSAKIIEDILKDYEINIESSEVFLPENVKFIEK